mmetsp:Transcript_6615/g.13394  ORF Transcript_6615/g.13394 Transcript_6615/m.13394 type:complete len:198 (+) Transcript_6615:238-831(+)
MELKNLDERSRLRYPEHEGCLMSGSAAMLFGTQRARLKSLELEGIIAYGCRMQIPELKTCVVRLAHANERCSILERGGLVRAMVQGAGMCLGITSPSQFSFCACHLHIDFEPSNSGSGKDHRYRPWYTTFNALSFHSRFQGWFPASFGAFDREAFQKINVWTVVLAKGAALLWFVILLGYATYIDVVRADTDVVPRF